MCVHRDREDTSQQPVVLPRRTSTQSQNQASCGGPEVLNKIDEQLQLLNKARIAMIERIRSCKFVKSAIKKRSEQKKKQKSADRDARRSLRIMHKTLKSNAVSQALADAKDAKNSAPKHTRVLTSLEKINKLQKQLAVLRDAMRQINPFLP